MSLDLTVMITVRWLSLAMLMQGIELLVISRRNDFLNIWSWENLKIELQTGLPFPNVIISKVFSLRGFQIISVTQIIMAFLGIVYPHSSLIFIILFLTHLLICIRFRGTFNGGSDMMTFVVLSGVIISLSGAEDKIKQLGLIYITIHSIYSYFKAGLVKVIQPEWRRAEVLPSFLLRSLFPEVQSLSGWLSSKRFLNFVLCWGVLILELTILGLFFIPKLLPLFVIGFGFFHFIVYLSFGLNRFFFIWMATWPAIIYTISLFR
jgi:hypothetical protein